MVIEDKVVRVVVGALAGILVFAGLVLAVSSGIRIAVAPLAAALKDSGKIAVRMDALETEIKGLKQALAARPQPQGNQPQQPSEEDLNKVYVLPADGSYVLGKADAKVTIVEFADFQCPFCARFHPAINEVYKAFPNDVKIMIKNYPLGFHPNARPAAKAALAAGLQGKYFEMADLLIASGNELSDAKYKEFAGKIGIDVEKFLQDLKDKDAEFEKKIEADMALAGKSDVRGTPTYFINGRKAQARNLQAWTDEVQALLKK
jgi:protein-disulfide isomerase